MNVQINPTGTGKGAAKEKMHDVFFHVFYTLHTVIRVKMHVLSPQQCSGIKPIYLSASTKKRIYGYVEHENSKAI